MSLNKIIIGFIVILLLFSAVIVLQIKRNPVPPSTITIDSHTFNVAVETTLAQQEQGLSGKASLPKNQGMLFNFTTTNRYAFWMKDMKFPLDIVFINNGKIVSISENVPVPTTSNENTPPVYLPTGPINQALEINAGVSKTDGFKTGDPVTVKLK
jgi:uncharacterized membrane protein (UPF0127 family)